MREAGTLLRMQLVIHFVFLISNLSRAQPSKLLNKCAIFHYFGLTLPNKYMFKLLLGTSTIFLCNNFLQKNNNLENSYQIRNIWALGCLLTGCLLKNKVHSLLLLVSFFSLLVTLYSLLFTRYSLLFTRYSLYFTRYFLLVTFSRYSLLFTRY